MAGGRWRRSGEGDHKGRPYESFDSGNAVGPADGQSPPGFSRDQEGGLSCPPFFFFEEKNHDVLPPSFEFTQRSEEGVKDDAPP